MKNLSSLVKKDLINLNNKSQNKAEFFDGVFEILKRKEYVRESFLKAIKVREEKYPTGLELPRITIAIPHTDVEHIKEPFVYINKMISTDLTFVQMGSDDVIVKPKFVIVLGIDNPKNQVGLLSELMEVFSNETFIDKLNNCSNNKEIYNLFKEKEV